MPGDLRHDLAQDVGVLFNQIEPGLARLLGGTRSDYRYGGAGTIVRLMAGTVFTVSWYWSL